MSNSNCWLALLPLADLTIPPFDAVQQAYAARFPDAPPPTDAGGTERLVTCSVGDYTASGPGFLRLSTTGLEPLGQSEIEVAHYLLDRKQTVSDGDTIALGDEVQITARRAPSMVGGEGESDTIGMGLRRLAVTQLAGALITASHPALRTTTHMPTPADRRGHGAPPRPGVSCRRTSRTSPLRRSSVCGRYSS